MYRPPIGGETVDAADGHLLQDQQAFVGELQIGPEDGLRAQQRLELADRLELAQPGEEMTVRRVSVADGRPQPVGPERHP